MCGVVGFIGASKDSSKTQSLITELFEKTQIRGTDACGFYAIDRLNNIHFHKQPGISSNLINKNTYTKIWDSDPILGIFHCRAASVGVGVPQNNINNHPFVSEDLKKAIIHNGLISAEEFNNLKNKYKIQSKCDSEIILRIIEKNDNIIENIQEFLNESRKSYFAIACAEKLEDSYRLTLTRNKHRPLFLIDLREELGQIIFFSTLEIFTYCTNNLKIKNNSIKTFYGFYNIKPYEIFCMTLDLNFNLEIDAYHAKRTKIIENSEYKTFSDFKEKTKKIIGLLEEKFKAESDIDKKNDYITNIDNIICELDSLNN